MGSRQRRTGNQLVPLDPTGAIHGIPTWPWGRAPTLLVTRRQLREFGLCPGGRPPVGQVVRGSYLFAWLYDLTTAQPSRVASPAQRRALAKALAARRTCGSCHRDLGYCLPKRWAGSCLDCQTPS